MVYPYSNNESLTNAHLRTIGIFSVFYMKTYTGCSVFHEKQEKIEPKNRLSHRKSLAVDNSPWLSLGTPQTEADYNSNSDVHTDFFYTHPSNQPSSR